MIHNCSETEIHILVIFLLFNRTARVERDSINSVALDDKPEDPHQRLLVAAVVTLNPSGSTLLARETTIMPAIPGFPALMSLLFCPSMEMRYVY